MQRLVSVVMTVLVLMAGAVQAQLGETPEVCDRRFGQPLKQTGSDGSWAFSRRYAKGDLRLEVRFIEFTIGCTNAGWIACTVSPDGEGAAGRREAFRLGVVPNWELLEETPVAKATPLPEAERLRKSNAIIAATRKTILQTLGWAQARCWMTPTLYAADDGHTVAIFSNIYLARTGSTQARPVVK